MNSVKSRRYQRTLMASLGVLFFLVFAKPHQVKAEPMEEFGDLNPSEYTKENIFRKIESNSLSKIECIYGYETAKHGMHKSARVILEYCAETKNMTQAMTLLSWMDENGYGLSDGPNLVSAANWDRRAAELGDSNAQFNYGLKLLAGCGVDKDIEKGKEYIDLAAGNGYELAQLYVKSGYGTSLASE